MACFKPTSPYPSDPTLRMVVKPASRVDFAWATPMAVQKESVNSRLL